MAAAPSREPSVCASAHSISETVTSPETLYQSARKCWKGVGRKFSAQTYLLHLIERSIELSNDLRDGTYREGPVRIVNITYPKKRTARSITFRDRTYQRSLNDLVLYPGMTRSAIWHNYACQKGKGTEAALQGFKAMLRRAYIKYGRTNRFQILSGDIKGYYDNMVHAKVEELIGRHVDPWTHAQVVRTLRHQYAGDKGYNPGSQMVQIAGISYLDPLDHYVKEVMRRKLYLRYMDDWHTPGAPDEDMAAVRDEIDAELAKVGLRLHPDKTTIRRASDGVVFLGFLFRVTDTGRVEMYRDPKRVKEIKRRFRRLARVVRRGDADWADFDNSLECVLACMRKGNSSRLIREMQRFAADLKKGKTDDDTRAEAA